jgi:ribose-phosphate pyrophosphokinase
MALKRLNESCIDELVTTNSTVVRSCDSFKITTLSVAGLLGEAIKRIHGGESVSSLFEINGRGNKES